MNLKQISDSNKLVDTIFLKDFNEENASLKALEEELKKIESTNILEAEKIQKNIYLTKQGLNGESRVCFELKNSLLPMLCFHDITIKSGENKAQIDFLVLTNKFMCILETKNLVGDITINQDGDFIREIKYKDGILREGMYNPITQGRRHARILRKVLAEVGITEVNNFPIKSIAVMANPKNIINKTDAPQEICKKVYRCDQVVDFLENEINSSEYKIVLPDFKIRNIANIVLKIASKESLKEKKDIDFNDLSLVNDFTNNSTAIPFANTYTKSKNNTGANIYDLSYSQNEKLVKKLRKFRYESAEANNRKPYEVFTNKEMDLIISIKPKTINDLKKINLRSWVVEELGIKLLQVINPGISYSKNECGQNDASNLEGKLKKYRYKIALEKNIKPYEIFTNIELSRLIEISPSTIDELFEIKGFNNREKIYKYGKDILSILNT